MGWVSWVWKLLGTYWKFEGPHFNSTVPQHLACCCKNHKRQPLLSEENNGWQVALFVAQHAVTISKHTSIFSCYNSSYPTETEEASLLYALPLPIDYDWIASANNAELIMMPGFIGSQASLKLHTSWQKGSLPLPTQFTMQWESCSQTLRAEIVRKAHLYQGTWVLPGSIGERGAGTWDMQFMMATGPFSVHTSGTEFLVVSYIN